MMLDVIRARRFQVMVHAGLLIFLGLLLLTVQLRAQGQDYVGSIQNEHRITSIETRLDNIEWVGKGILLIVATQLVATIFKSSPRRRD